jgi:hypothetical protein
MLIDHPAFVRRGRRDGDNHARIHFFASVSLSNGGLPNRHAGGNFFTAVDWSGFCRGEAFSPAIGESAYPGVYFG